MLGIFGVKSAVPSSFVSDSGELSGIVDLPLNKNAFAMEPLLNLSNDINGRSIFSKLKMWS